MENKVLSFLHRVTGDIEGIPGDIRDIGVNVIHQGENALDVLNAGRQGVQGLANYIGNEVTGNDVAAQNTLNKTNAAMNASLNASRGLVTPEEAQNADLFGNSQQRMAFLHPVERGVVTYAPYAVAPEFSAAVGGMLPEGASAAAKLGVGTATNFGFNTATNVAQQAVNGQPINIGQATKGAIGPTVFGAAVEGAPIAFQASTNALKNATPLNEVGAIGPGAGNILDDAMANKLAKLDDPQAISKQLEPQLGKPLANEVAPSVAKASDPNVIQRMVQNSVGSKLPVPTAPARPNIASPSDNQFVKAGQGSEQTANKPFLNPPGNAPQATTLMDNTGSGVERGFISSVKESPSVSPQVQAAVDRKYNPISNKQLNEQTGTLLDKGLDKAMEQVSTALTKPTGSMTAQEASDAMTVARALDNMGRYQEATNIYNRLSEHGTASGQFIQSLSMLTNRTPEGLNYWVNKTLDQAKVPISGSLKDNLQAAFDSLKETQPGSSGYDFAVGKIQQLVGDSLPKSASENLFGLWRAGLLTGPQTVAKILTSHGVNAVAENIKEIPATAIDKFLSLFTGQRSDVLTLKGEGQGFVEGAQKGATLLKTGVDITPGSNAMEVRTSANFGNSVPAKFLNAYVNGVGRIHGSLYKPFYGMAHLNSLYSQALAAAKTEGLKGAESDAFVTKFLHDPSPDALKIAQHDAEMMTFQQTTKLGQVATALQQKGGIIGKVIAPFTRIPSAIATDLIHYTPIGGMKSIIDGIKSAKSEEGLTVEAQRQLVQGLGRSITGTAALIPGIMLYNRGMMTLEYPTDPKEQALWADEGKQPNSVLIGGQWHNLGAIGPLGSVLAVGGHIGDSLLQGKDMGTATLEGLAGGLKSIESQSYLQGVNNAVNATNQPGQYAANFAKQTAGSIVPTAFNTIANATDQYQRQTTGDNMMQDITNAIKSRLPFARETLSKKVDTFGNPLKSGETGLERVVDPFQSSTNAIPGSLLQELRRLENAGYGEMPTKVSKKVNFGSVSQPMNAQLTQKQVTQLQTIIGQMTEQQWNQAIQDPNYQSLTDDQKQTELKNIYDAVARQGRAVFAQFYKLGPYSANPAQTIQQSKQKRLQVI